MAAPRDERPQRLSEPEQAQNLSACTGNANTGWNREQLMATTEEPRTALVPGLHPQRQSLGKAVVSWLTSTDHKIIGYLYLITSFTFFLIGGILAMTMRLEL